MVAAEVRSLAQRSPQAAKDIKDLITNSGGQGQEGVNLVNKAGQALQEIVESIKTVASIVAEIAHGQRRAVVRHRAGQQGADPDGRGDAAELGAGRGERRHRQGTRAAGGRRWTSACRSSTSAPR